MRELLTSPVNTRGRTVTDSEIVARRRTVSLDQAATAHRALGTHFLGRLALRPR